MSAARLLAVRHGQSWWNAERRFQGQADVGLTPQGEQQAHLVAASVARHLDGAAVTVVASDLSRARETAAAIGCRVGVQVEVDPALREVHAGHWQGLVHEEIEAADPHGYRAWRAGDDVPLGGAERPSESGDRVCRAVRGHLRAVATDWLVVVGHGTSLRAGVPALLGVPELRGRLGALGNACSAELIVPRPDHDAVLLRWNTSPEDLGAPLGRAPSGPATV